MIRGKEDLPDVGIKAIGRHVLLLVEPKKTTTDAGLILPDDGFDDGHDPGIGWVLSASKKYVDQNPSNWVPDPAYEDLCHLTSNDVKAGDKVLFRRFMKSDNAGQGLYWTQRKLQEKFPGYELVFLHVQHLIGVIESD
jgi:co-chaperonin GroES (HSP10)